MHYRVSDPFGAVLAFVIIPLAFGLQVRFVIRRKTFHLLFCKIHLKIVIVFCGGVQLLSGHNELLAGQPAAGIDDDVANVPGSMSKSGRDALKELAASTGGVAFFPQTLDEVDEITREIAHDIRSQYTITYNPGAKIGTGYQTIRVEAKGPGRSHFTVRTRNGYYPGEAMK